MIEIRFWASVQICDDSDIFFKEIFALLKGKKYQIFGIIYEFQVPAVEGRSVSATRVKTFSVGQMSIADPFS